MSEHRRFPVFRLGGATLDRGHHRRLPQAPPGGHPEYCPDRPVTRAEMAVFLVKAFGLVLYGPPRVPQTSREAGAYTRASTQGSLTGSSRQARSTFTPEIRSTGSGWETEVTPTPRLPKPHMGLGRPERPLFVRAHIRSRPGTFSLPLHSRPSHTGFRLCHFGGSTLRALCFPPL